MREIIRASAWGGFQETVEAFGGDPEEILAAAHVDPANLADPERYLPLKSYIASQEIAAKRLNRPDFGLRFGQHQKMSMLGALSIAVVNAPTAREGIEMCARYLHVHNPAFGLSLSPVPNTTREFIGIQLNLRKPETGCEQNEERIVSSFHRSMAELGGSEYRALEIRFTHARISPLSVYRDVFGVTPQFNQAIAGIGISRAILDAWRPGSSAQLRQVAEAYLRTLGPPRGDSFSLRVSAVTRSLLESGECSSAQAAQALGIHERTLQRRLKDEGATFESIKDDIKKDRAEALLAQPGVTLSQIAAMLHYADSSAFSRSARRWFGESPRSHRARLLARPPKAKAGPRRTDPLASARRLASRI